MFEFGSPESRAYSAVFNNKKALEEAARKAKNTAIKNEVIRIRKDAGISGTGGANVAKVFRPSTGRGIGGIMGNKQK